MKDKKKPKYNMWQNTGFMIQNAWRVCKSVIFLCIALAVVSAGQTAAEMLLAPSILKRIETRAPLRELIAAIAVFSFILLILSGLKTYINQNAMFGRIEVRSNIIRQIGDKVAGTSYPNVLTAEFVSLEDKAFKTCSPEYIWSVWTGILTNAMGFGFYLALLSGLKPWLLFLVIATTVAGYFVNKHINEWSYEHKEEEAACGKKMGYIRQAATGRRYAKDIRIFGLREWMEDVWNSTLKLYRGFLARRERVCILANVADMLLALLRNGIAYVYLIRLVLARGMSASEFLLYFAAVSGFTQWVTGILDMFSQLHRQSLDLSMLREFLEWPEPFRFEEGTPLAKDLSKGYEIRLENATFRYPGADKDTLSHINLTIRPCEKLAVVGLNGAGKTTLVKLVCGFLDPTEGRVLLNGQDIREYNRRDYYALFSAVFQDFSVLEASVAENVAQRVDGIDEQRVRDCLKQAGLEEKIRSLPQGIRTNIGREVYEDGVELSGGQLQRLMLARALYKDGPILVLDEPTAALDPIAESDIYMKYNEMTAGRASLFISHRLASTRFCDRILYISEGRIAEEGTHDSLLALGGGYAELFEVQSWYYKEGGKHHGE